MDRQQLLTRIERAWDAFNQSCAGLTDASMLRPGVVGEWSVKDLLAHIAIWEDETMKALPLLLQGKRPPPYNGIDRFNAEQIAARSHLSLPEARQQLNETHRRLLTYLETLPEPYFVTESRVRRRLRLDTYGHYPEHTEAIREWRRAAAL
jgi:uncharacterized protein (TIGR03083 family)